MRLPSCVRVFRLLSGGLPETVSIQTLTAFSFSLVQTYAQAVGRRDPELISGPDERMPCLRIFCWMWRAGLG